MKKYCFYVLSLFMATAMSVSLSSCGDDDDEVGGGGTLSPEVTTVTDANGVPYRVTSCCQGSSDGYFYEYDQNGKLTKISVDWMEDEKLTDLYTGGSSLVLNYDIDGDSEKTTISLNSQGLVSGFTSTAKYEEHNKYENYSGQYNEKASCSYNSAGQMVKYSSNGTYSETEDGEKYSGSWTISSELTWSNGNLVKIVSKWSEVEDGEKDSGTETTTYTYGTQPNPAKQWLSCMSSFEDGSSENIYALMPLGLFGRGPAYLPTKYTYIESDDSYHENHTPTYVLNDNGTIKSDEEWVYTYDAASAEEVKAQMKQMMPTMRKAHRSMSHRIHARRMARK